MPIDYSLFAISKGEPRQLRESFKKREHQRYLDEAYAIVDARDGIICRVTGRQLLKGTPQQRPHKSVWLTRHHMYGRDQANRYNPKTIFVVCWEAHDALQRYLIEIEGTDADRRLIFRWNRRLVPIGKEPFRLKSKRWSQNV